MKVIYKGNLNRDKWRKEMKYIEVIEDFLGQQEEDTKKAYRKKIYSFMEYTIEKKDATDSNYVSVLKDLSIHEFMESLQYYVKLNDVVFKASADLFYSVVRSFFHFISLEYRWNNPIFEEKKNETAMKLAYEKMVEELKLRASSRTEPINSEMALSLIHICDEKLDNADFDKLINGNGNGVFSNYISALISKFVLLYGLSINTIREISINDYDSRFGKMFINGYCIHLQDKLKIQMDNYIQFRQRVDMNKENKNLFIDFKRVEKKKMDNTMMFFILKNVIGTNQSTAVAKYAIIDMIKSGLPVYIIKEFTGYKNDICNHCQEIVDGEDGPASRQEKNRMLDSIFRKSNLSDVY